MNKDEIIQQLNDYIEFLELYDVGILSLNIIKWHIDQLNTLKNNTLNAIELFEKILKEKD